MRCVLGALFLVVAACAPASPVVAPESRSPGPAAELVNASILTNGCQHLGRANAQLAERAMYGLVEGCTSVPGRIAQFEATLEPDGTIVISGVSGQADVIPICVVKHALVHKVPLTSPCRLDVRMEQSTVPLIVDGGGG